jgi:glycosyltransferase involved in cell wall biosynthesis
MRILQVIPAYLPATRYGGPSYSVHGLSRGLASLGHEVHVFTTNVDGPGTSDVPVGVPVDMDGVSVWYFEARMPRRLFYSAELRRALLREVHKFAIVHLHSVFLWPTAAAARIAARTSVPYVLSPRGMLVRDLVQRRSQIWKTAWIKLFERWNVEHAAAIHVTAPVEADALKAFRFALPAVCVVPNGVDAVTSTHAEPVSEDVRKLHGTYILSIGRLNWKKNLPVLIRAFSHLDAVHLVIAGNPEDGHGEELKALVRQLNLGKRVTVLDRTVQGADKEYLYSRCHAFVLASISENFGNVALEAMARGKPVIASRHAGVAAIVGEFGCGIVVEPIVEDLAAAMNRLLEDPQLAREMGARGAAAVKQRFGWTEIARQMSESYDWIVDRNRRPHIGRCEERHFRWKSDR